MDFNAQVEQFINGHLFRLLAGLGASKAIEVIISHYVGVWHGKVVFWICISVMALFIAAKSPEIQA